MHVAEKFRVSDPALIAAEINRIRFGTLVTRGEHFDATPIPWVAELADSRRIVLHGHLARHNPQVAALRGEVEVLIVFTGANGYISPRWLPTPRSAPTWNYIAVHVVGPCRLLDPGQTEAVVERLVAAQESARAQPWSTREMGPRRGQLIQHVIGVTIEATRYDAKFKLGQNESAADLEGLLAGLEREGQHELSARIREAN